jgi:hypothetical protein
MPRKGLFVPKLHDKNVRRLYHHAHRLAMPVSKLLNLIVAVGLEELSQVNDPDAWEVYVPVRTEEPDSSLCSDSSENTTTPIVEPC